ncbi:hypothetical protein M378DRAFT_84362 [Amanita muscaria Koide BX008]|uniref:Fe2OG dioxygenase domain-containing protein n=1 Tax=Amanita muscaria (strain Koide BX008) TaxID=946122 RepID=A0A0C2T0M1_AMAMK|nr:hypothetical protein M378DRAFT_84362 [Amanita muscaria Koide BX008]
MEAIPGCDTIWYIPNFITEDEEQYLIRKAGKTSHHKWKHLGNRRLQVWGGEILQNGTLLKQPLPQFLVKYPNIISRLKSTSAFTSSPHGEPNHVILNEYLQGQGIMPHEDGPIYHPVVATISLGSHTMFHYYQYANEPSGQRPHEAGRSIDPNPVVSLLLERRSLIVTTGEMYMGHLHGIEETNQDDILQGALVSLKTGDSTEIANQHLLTDKEIIKVMEYGGSLKRGTRHSLTFRDVGRVAKQTLICNT